MPETPDTTSAFEPECWCDSAPCECPGSPKTPEAAPVPQHLGVGYDAVWAYVAELNDRSPDVTRNAAIWRGIEVFKAATLPAHEATVRRAYHAELFGTPEEIRQREIEAKVNAKPDDPIELVERALPGHVVVSLDDLAALLRMAAIYREDWPRAAEDIPVADRLRAKLIAIRDRNQP